MTRRTAIVVYLALLALVMVTAYGQTATGQPAPGFGSFSQIRVAAKSTRPVEVIVQNNGGGSALEFYRVYGAGTPTAMLAKIDSGGNLSAVSFSTIVPTATYTPTPTNTDTPTPSNTPTPTNTP